MIMHLAYMRLALSSAQQRVALSPSLFDTTSIPGGYPIHSSAMNSWK